mmetsp:Transcript_27577/g.35826  ORF Transcript_27577/g.35826 Transcript_27577/m.35826 type:complete len:325 (+) Transcript_27577:1-975(+)
MKNMFPAREIGRDLAQRFLPMIKKAGCQAILWAGNRLSSEDRDFLADKWTKKDKKQIEPDNDIMEKSQNIDENISRSKPFLNFGKMIRDFGFKQAYSVGVDSLLDIPVWKSQRIYRKERAELIARENDNFQGLPGVITLFVSRSKDTFNEPYLIDGQHRIGALGILKESGKLNGYGDVLVEVFPVNGESDVKKLFTEINSAQPVKLIDLPEEADKIEKQIVGEAVEKLKLAYPEMFKVSSRCLPPHVNIDNLRDDLYQARIINRQNVTSSDQLLEWIVQMNTQLSQRNKLSWLNLKKGSRWKKAVEKAISHNFFLGLDKGWLYV